jgi:hypothetical protein
VNCGYSIARIILSFERPDMAPEDDRTMRDLAIELCAIEHLAALVAMNITNVADAKSAFGPTERGLDVVFDLGGRRIGAQRGSLSHAREESTARQTRAPFGVWGVADYRRASRRAMIGKRLTSAAAFPCSEM